MHMTQASSEFLQGYFSTHDRSPKTRAAYCSDLAQFQSFAGGELELLKLDGALIERWAAHLRQESYSPASMRRKMVLLKVFCSYWVRKGELQESPFWRVKLSFGKVQQLPRSLTEREMCKLIAQARRNYSEFEIDPWEGGDEPSTPAQSSLRSYRALRNLALVDLLFATGMRVGEAAALDIRDFQVREAFFRVKGKGGRDRLAFIVDEGTLQIQRAHLEVRKQIETENPAIFLNAAGGRLSTQGIGNMIVCLRRDSGIERHVTPHMLRHTVATLLLRNGADIRIVQEFLGHTSIATTQRYTHVAKEHLIGVLRKRHPSFDLWAVRSNPVKRRSVRVSGSRLPLTLPSE
jgi:integrase/recombinase XerD